MSDLALTTDLKPVTQQESGCGFKPQLRLTGCVPLGRLLGLSESQLPPK
jgi:hypothetical protein